MIPVQSQKHQFLPIMAAEDDVLAAELAGELGQVVGDAFVAVVVEGVGRCVLVMD